MTTVLLVIHLLIALAMIGVVLLQRSEGGGLGIGGGGGGGMGGFMTGRGTANLLTRATAILAACFMVTSILLTILAGGGLATRSILDAPPSPASPAAPGPAVPQEPGTGGALPQAPAAPTPAAPTPAAPTPAAPATDGEPSVPVR